MSNEEKADFLESISFWSRRTGGGDVRVNEVTSNKVHFEDLATEEEYSMPKSQFLSNYEPNI